MGRNYMCLEAIKRKEQAGFLSLFLIYFFAVSVAIPCETITDPEQKYAWGINVGWLNAGPTNHEVTVCYNEENGGWLSGHIWGENIGWIAMGNLAGGPYSNTDIDNWGVNLMLDGKLSGYAWGENIGWLNFEQIYGHPAINLTNGTFLGYAWAENLGWISLGSISSNYGLRTQAFDRQAQGTPNYWLAHYGVQEDHDGGDGVVASDKYVMDVDPTVSNNYLRITSITKIDGKTDVAFTPASMRRYYTLSHQENLTGTNWASAVGHTAIPGAGGEQVITNEASASNLFYRISVFVNP